jgi:hypothetical protein
MSLRKFILHIAATFTHLRAFCYAYLGYSY